MFGSLFDNLYVQRYDKQGNIVGKIHVPLAWADKAAWYRKLKEDRLEGDLPPMTLSLPRMYFDLIEMKYDGDRQLDKTMRMSLRDKSRPQAMAVRNRVPWNFTFELGIASDTNADAIQLLESFLPYFSPEYVVSVNDLSDLDIQSDIPVILDSGPVRDHAVENDFSKIRVVAYKLTFTVRGYMYQPVSKQGIITKTIINLSDVKTSALYSQIVGTAMEPDDHTKIDVVKHIPSEAEVAGASRSTFFADIKPANTTIPQ